VAGAVGAGGVPGHADEEGAVMAIVRRPPGLAVGHQRFEIALHRVIVERPELLPIIEIVAHRVAVAAVLVEDFEAELVRPPIAIGPAEEGSHGRAGLAGIVEGVAGLRVHDPSPVAFWYGSSLRRRMDRKKRLNLVNLS